MKRTISIMLVLTAGWISAFSQINLSNGLLAHWSFEGNANDVSGNGNDGTLVGDATFATGIVGNALLLDGNRDFVEVNRGLNTQSLTICAWIKVNNAEKEWSSLFTKKTHNDTMAYWAGLHFAKPIIYINQAGVNITEASTSIDPNKWYFITYIVDNGDAKIRFCSNIDATATVSIHINQNNSLVLIGASESGEAGSDFEGLIDELRVYNRKLNTSEIDSLARQGSPNPDPCMSVGIADNNSHGDFNVYPTIGDGRLYIEFDEIADNPTISIYNSNGALIHFDNSINKSVLKQKINLSAYPKGIYLLKVKTDTQILTQKLIIQ